MNAKFLGIKIVVKLTQCLKAAPNILSRLMQSLKSRTEIDEL